MGDDSTRDTTMSSSDILLPAEQQSVPFYGHELLAVRLPDGRICAVLRWLCEGMGLDPQAQLRRIKRKPALARDLVTVRVKTAGGPQDMPALALHGLPGWLYGIDESRVNEAARAGVLRFQYEATDVLYRYFAERPAELAPLPDLAPAEAIEKPTKPAKDAAPDVLADYYEGMVMWLRWQSDIAVWRQGVEAWRDETESRLESVEEVTRLVPELLDRLGPATLSPEHQATVRASVKRLHDLTGASFGGVYADLCDTFHTAKYSDIPESQWREVAVWFSTRIAAAERCQLKQ